MISSRLPLAFAGIALAGIALTGCSVLPSSPSGAQPAAGGSTASAPASGSGTNSTAVDACTLFTAADASAATGQSYTTATGSGDMCTYTSASNAFFVIITNGASDADWAEATATAKEDGGSALTTFSGVGDRAAGAGLELDVQAHGHIIDVHGADQGGNPDFPVGLAVAKAVAAKLG